MTTPDTPHDTTRQSHSMPQAEHVQDVKPQATAQHAAERYALAAAGTVIIALTAGGFWLSYAHLAQVAGQHGLGSSPVRQWAWPATLDAFIVAGELLMLRAGLRRVTDWWAVTLTATGSVGSIALNVAGVSGTGNASVVPLLDYVVAAVPPTSALLAFGVLMRQIHQLVDRPFDRPALNSAEAPETAGHTIRTHRQSAGNRLQPNATAQDFGGPAAWWASGQRDGRGTGRDRTDRRGRAAQAHTGHRATGHTCQGTYGRRPEADRSHGSPPVGTRRRSERRLIARHPGGRNSYGHRASGPRLSAAVTHPHPAVVAVASARHHPAHTFRRTIRDPRPEPH